MSESRRRRKCSGEDSDILSDVSTEIAIKSHSEQESDVDNSDYESLDEGQTLGEEDKEVAAITAESTEEKKLDDDEDRKNPQYIPKKGTFYEHDIRMGSDKDENNEKTPSEAGDKVEIKKKIWKENDKWQHDKFDFTDQAPKSRDELITAYGYDIRNEEVPPRARRRRRYGRGPNKYTRNWEDFDAYKPTRGRASAEPDGGKARSHDINAESDFPPLGSSNDNNRGRNYNQEGEQLQLDTTIVANSEASVNNSNHVAPPDNRMDYRGRKEQNYSKSYRDSNSYRGRGTYNRGGRGDNRNYGYQSRYRDNYAEGSYRGRNDREGHRGSYSSKPNSAEYREELNEVMDKLKATHIDSQKEDYKVNRNEASIPPRLQEKVKSPKTSPSQSADVQSKTTKRYSSQRQRAMADQNPAYQHNYYEQEAPKHSTPNKNYMQPAYTSASTSFPAETYIPRVPAPQNITPVTRPHLIPGPPMVVQTPITGTVAGAPALAVPAIIPSSATAGGPAVTGPPYLATENIINYGPTPAILATPPQFPPYQSYNTMPQPTPTEIYSNGVTYYNTHNQQHPRIAVPLQKRPKAAIPIVPPPEDDSEIKSSQEISDDADFLPRELEDDESVDTLHSDDLIYEDSFTSANKCSQENYACEDSVPSNYELQANTEEEGYYNVADQEFAGKIEEIAISSGGNSDSMDGEYQDEQCPQNCSVEGDSSDKVTEDSCNNDISATEDSVSNDKCVEDDVNNTFATAISVKDDTFATAISVNNDTFATAISENSDKSVSENSVNNDTCVIEENNDKSGTEDSFNSIKSVTEDSINDDKPVAEDSANNDSFVTEDSVNNDTSVTEESINNDTSVTEESVDTAATARISET